MPDAEKNKKQPVPAKAAATVILVDDRPPQNGGAGAFSIYLLKRAAESSFMPGRFVFPGGTLEPEDGPPASGGDSPTLRACAIRETFEESGVMLVRELDRAAKLKAEDINPLRQAVHQGELYLPHAFGRLGLSPAPERLTPFAHWITPQGRPRRFDAVFYVAAMPPGQTAASDHLETSQGLWLSPETALAENRSGRTVLAPPQVRLVGELAAFASAKELFEAAAEKQIKPVKPVLIFQEDQRAILLPWDADFPAGKMLSPAAPCPAAEASRLVFTQGHWLPFATAG